MPREIEISERAKEAFEVIIGELNKMTNEKSVEQALEEVLYDTHRTLKQNFFRHVILPAIAYYSQSYDEGWYDLRNEASCELAAKLNESCVDAPLPYI